ncbi:uracil-DNA glycosylase [Aquitalea magnusonii]|uniref:Type-4 uracil-DNA glycosylase n=1 Tax=Aquitalea magnusonii TaxID=332411 RepID=A0A318J567_9NEIS|nr:uracil-DNA glycosylase [Aquitalea magnusonii]PXX42271.1 DNA polymerase [Aquitalea magnusonii]
MNRSRFIQQAIGLGPQWQARSGWFEQHPAELERKAWQLAQQQASQSAATAAEIPPAITAVTEADAQLAAPLLVTSPAAMASTPELISVAAPVTAIAEQPAAAPLPLVELSWEQLEQAVANCQNCQLCQTRSQTVFGRGNPQARWMLIGEAPGEQEDRQGQPFVGKAGQLLDNMLAAAGLDRENDVYIANVLKCRPPGNRNPAPAEILACSNYLQQQIRHVQPTLILALGRFAVQTLLQTEQSIGKLRGQLHHYQGIPLIATYHPAYLLRNLPDKAKAWQDMVLAKQHFNRLSKAASLHTTQPQP